MGHGPERPSLNQPKKETKQGERQGPRTGLILCVQVHRGSVRVGLSVFSYHARWFGWVE